MGKKLTQEEFETNIKERHPNLKILGEYKGSHIKILTKCLTCGYEWMCQPSNIYALVKGTGCPKCGRKRDGANKAISQEIVLERFRKIFPQYDYSKVIYKNSETKVCIICPKHGEFWITPSNLYAGHGCPKCSFEKSSTTKFSNTKEFIQKATEIHGNYYDYSKVEYISAKTPVIIICPKHGEFLQQPNAHLNKQGCPKCKRSKGELLIESILISKNINFVTQYKVKNFKIDFFIPATNTFIEYNGAQHYILVEYFGGEIKFSKQQLRDENLRKYCKENKINLIEIPYTKTESEIKNMLNAL